jgi:hypothetical protein
VQLLVWGATIYLWRPEPLREPSLEELSLEEDSFGELEAASFEELSFEELSALGLSSFFSFDDASLLEFPEDDPGEEDFLA